MIVMKFGGSSVESSEAIRRVCGIVKTHQKQHPVVVVSAIGKTTNQLLEMAASAAKGHGFFARRYLNQIQDAHYGIADDLLSGPRYQAAGTALQNAFRELHGLIHDLAEDGAVLTPALSDHIVSFGERLSSELVAAALLELHVPAVHADARDFIVTDDRHGAAAPLYWNTYARLRRWVPGVAQSSVVVMGGFIGATEDGVTTTLGRGGSDLTASLVGAGISAEEIQIWTDVDGMLTWDPRVMPGGFRLRSISYEEATAMAVAGAKVLHPDSVKPAVRQRIPVVIRTSRHPEREGTRIVPVAGECANPVKTIAVKQNLMVLEMTSNEIAAGPGFIRILHDFCYRKNIEPALLCHRENTVFLGLHTAAGALSELEMELAGCVEVHLRDDSALISLIGPEAGKAAAQAVAALRGVEVTLISANPASHTASLLVPQRDLRRSMLLLHREFFTEVDAAAFSRVPVEVTQPKPQPDRMLAFTLRKNALFSSFGMRRNPTA